MEGLHVNQQLLKYISAHDTEVVKGLVSSSPRPDLEFGDEHDGETALHHAAGAGYFDIVECLLSAGAKVDATDRHGQTPLHMASFRRNIRVVELLVQYAENAEKYINMSDSRKRNALHEAVQRGDEEIIEFLLKRGADPRACNLDGYNPAHVACEGGLSGMMRLLLNKDLTAINDQAGDDLNRRTCLHMAAANNNADDVEWLLTQNANPSVKDANGMTAWEVACNEKANGNGGGNFEAISAFAYMESEVDNNFWDLTIQVTHSWYHVQVYDVRQNSRSHRDITLTYDTENDDMRKANVPPRKRAKL